MNMESASKALTTTVVVVGVLIASFFFAYIFIIIAILGLVGSIAYLFFNWGNIFKSEETFMDN